MRNNVFDVTNEIGNSVAVALCCIFALSLYLLYNSTGVVSMIGLVFVAVVSLVSLYRLYTRSRV